MSPESAEPASCGPPTSSIQASGRPVSRPAVRSSPLRQRTGSHASTAGVACGRRRLGRRAPSATPGPRRPRSCRPAPAQVERRAAGASVQVPLPRWPDRWPAALRLATRPCHTAGRCATPATAPGQVQRQPALALLGAGARSSVASLSRPLTLATASRTVQARPRPGSRRRCTIAQLRQRHERAPARAGSRQPPCQASCASPRPAAAMLRAKPRAPRAAAAAQRRACGQVRWPSCAGCRGRRLRASWPSALRLQARRLQGRRGRCRRAWPAAARAQPRSLASAVRTSKPAATAGPRPSGRARCPGAVRAPAPSRPASLDCGWPGAAPRAAAGRLQVDVERDRRPSPFSVRACRSTGSAAIALCSAAGFDALRACLRTAQPSAPRHSPWRIQLPPPTCASQAAHQRLAAGAPLALRAAAGPTGSRCWSQGPGMLVGEVGAHAPRCRCRPAAPDSCPARLVCGACGHSAPRSSSRKSACACGTGCVGPGRDARRGGGARCPPLACRCPPAAARRPAGRPSARAAWRVNSSGNFCGAARHRRLRSAPRAWRPPAARRVRAHAWRGRGSCRRPSAGCRAAAVLRAVEAVVAGQSVAANEASAGDPLERARS